MFSCDNFMKGESLVKHVGEIVADSLKFRHIFPGQNFFPVITEPAIIFPSKVINNY